ncbi:MAG: ABC transporter substrate-binding protein, partial [Candidatus Saccharimonas sp.]|nr:ABC transporter substrate-binding protein [Planctomycetaceae bacterium]
MSSQTSNGRWLVLFPVFAALVLTGFWFAGPSRDALVVYCAHDKVYADAILKDFERQTGIRVDVRYDT